jgi:CTP synthase (UTP-ammonia lyase)
MTVHFIITVVLEDIGILQRLANHALQDAGLCLSGMSPDGRLVETIEIPEEEFFVGVQFHPEFKSRPNKPHPLFLGFIGAAADVVRE